MILWLASYPRSGNTFFRLLLRHLYGIETYSVYYDSLLEEVVGQEKLPASLDELRQREALYLIKTHEVPLDDSKAIYLVRDGRDAMVSFAHYTMNFTPPPAWHVRTIARVRGADRLQQVLKDLVCTDNRHYGWSGNVNAWMNRPYPTAIIRFEDLIGDPVRCTNAALNRLDLPIKPISDTLPSFEELHQKWPAFFRKGKVGAWTTEMPANLQEIFWARHGETMKKLGYTQSPAGLLAAPETIDSTMSQRLG